MISKEIFILYLLIPFCSSTKQKTSSLSPKQIFTKGWCPVVPVSDIDISKPNAATILGKKIVFWRSNNVWSVADDSCPHRLVPLSLGRIKNSGELQCRYHGWCFKSDGFCSAIPQSENEHVAISSKRSSLTSYPTQIHQGILWFWPDRDTAAEALTTPPPIFPEFDDGICAPVNIVPMDYEVMLENTFDPSHAMWLHHGSGFDSKNALPMTNFSVATTIKDSGFTLVHSGYEKKNKDMEAFRLFQAPYTNFVKYIMKPNNMIADTVLYFVPVSPGFTRVMGQFNFQSNNTSKNKYSIFQFFKSIIMSTPIWMKHVQGIKIVEQDIFMLNSQKLRLQALESSGKTWNREYYLPSRADVGVVAFRKWFDKFCNNDVPWLHLESESEGLTLSSDNDEKETKIRKQLAPEADQDFLLSRYHRHTKDCIHCSRALSRFHKISDILSVGAGVSAGVSLVLGVMQILIAIGDVTVTTSKWALLKHTLVSGGCTGVLAIARGFFIRMKQLLVTGSYPYKK